MVLISGNKVLFSVNGDETTHRLNHYKTTDLDTEMFVGGSPIVDEPGRCKQELVVDNNNVYLEVNEIYSCFTLLLLHSPGFFSIVQVYKVLYRC